VIAPALSFTIPRDVVPSQMGHMLTNGRVVKATRVKDYQAHARDYVQLAVNRAQWTATPGETFAVTLRVFVGDLRTIDVDNCAKSLLDAMKRVAFPDDRQVVELHVYKALDRERPRVEVEVRRIVDG
jgi:Holliday junction resolvase RusA-like endonuclease